MVCGTNCAVKVNKYDFDNTKCVLFVILLIIFNIYHSMWSCLYTEVSVNNTWRIISYLNSFVTQTNLINFYHLVTVISKEIQLSQLFLSQLSNTLKIHWWREYMAWHSQINTFSSSVPHQLNREQTRDKLLFMCFGNI